jgi:hypothetical protein
MVFIPHKSNVIIISSMLSMFSSRVTFFFANTTVGMEEFGEKHNDNNIKYQHETKCLCITLPECKTIYGFTPILSHLLTTVTALLPAVV